MTKSSLVAVTVLLACAILVGGYWFSGTDGDEQAERPMQPAGSTEPTDEAAGKKFAKWGNIVNVENTTAGLVYEEPGKPALKADLVFTMATICVTDGKEATCPVFSDKPFFAQGARVYVEGVKEGNIVTVTKISEQAAE